MYSREERIRAVELWIKYRKRSRAVIKELGYPSRTLLLWYKDYLQEQETGILHNCRRGVLKYTEGQKQVAIDHYLEHGKCMVASIRALGYPGRDLLARWCRDVLSDHHIPPLYFPKLISWIRSELLPAF